MAIMWSMDCKRVNICSEKGTTTPTTTPAAGHHHPTTPENLGVVPPTTSENPGVVHHHHPTTPAAGHHHQGTTTQAPPPPDLDEKEVIQAAIAGFGSQLIGHVKRLLTTAATCSDAETMGMMMDCCKLIKYTADRLETRSKIMKQIEEERNEKG